MATHKYNPHAGWRQRQYGFPYMIQGDYDTGRKYRWWFKTIDDAVDYFLDLIKNPRLEFQRLEVMDLYTRRIWLKL